MRAQDVEKTRDEYREYLERMASAYPERTPLTREGFEQMEVEWKRDYDALWKRVDSDPEAWPKIQRLEYLLGV